MDKLSILIADDHPIFRKGMRALLASLPEAELIGEVSNGAEAARMAAEMQPDVVLMDLQMPGGNGLDAIRQITQTSPHIRILVVTMFEDDDSVFAAMRAGARGYVLKDAGDEEITRAILAVGKGEAIFSPAIALRMMQFFNARPALPQAIFPDLTESERNVLRLMAQGVSNDAIAEQLHFSPKTVRNYVSNIFSKLQVADRAQAIVKAREAGFFLKAIQRFGQPALDVGCGTGRVLLPLLQAGIDIDGCDISADMLSHCRRKAAGLGFNPNLSAQPMHAFDLPRTYKTIYICGSFDLGGTRENDLGTLRRCYAHLEVGGALLLNIQAEYTSPEAWALWLSENRKALPQPWPEATPRRASDGSEHTGRFRTIDVDPLEQTYTRQVQLEKRSDGVLVASEEYTLRGNTYFKPELLLMLQVAGFSEITVTGDYTDAPATADSEEIVFTAMK